MESVVRYTLFTDRRKRRTEKPMNGAGIRIRVYRRSFLHFPPIPSDAGGTCSRLMHRKFLHSQSPSPPSST